MLAHILGEVSIFCIVLLSVPWRKGLPIFIEVGLYLTDTEQKKCWQFLRHGVGLYIGL